MPNDTDAERPRSAKNWHAGTSGDLSRYRAFRALLFEKLGTHSLSPSLRTNPGLSPELK
jgi:hypothetical protein